MKKSLIALGTLCCALAFAPSANAAPGCWGTAPKHQRDPNTGALAPTPYCFVYRSGDLSPFTGTVGPTAFNTAELHRGRSWFVCQQRGADNPPVGNARNNFWLYTLGDKILNGSSGWGWFPANRVSGGAPYQPIPGLRTCYRKKNA